MKRMEKYGKENDNTEFVPKRSVKNEDLYKNIDSEDLDNFRIESNARVIGESDSNIDVERIKEILERNYQDIPKRSKISFEEESEPIEEVLERTREYDINTILEKAKEGKEVDYEKDRLKKIRDTQYNILKSLDLDEEEEKKEIKSSTTRTNEEILNLINTITENELIKTTGSDVQSEIVNITSELDPLDLLTDLKGNENTALLGAENFTKELETIRNSDVEEEKNQVYIKNHLEQNTELESKTKIDDSFYTKNLMFEKDDFENLYDDEKEFPLWGKIILIIVVIAIIVGIIFFLNQFLHLGLF